MPIKGWNRERPEGKSAGRYIDTFVAFELPETPVKEKHSP